MIARGVPCDGAGGSGIGSESEPFSVGDAIGSGAQPSSVEEVIGSGAEPSLEGEGAEPS